MIPKIIGISGVSGAGKTTLANALGQALQSTVLRWDDFDAICNGPDDYVDWDKRGKNYSEWNYQALADALKSLKSNQAALHLALDEQLNPTPYIIVDAPLGRLHQQTSQYIDICIHITVPLDISLCRRVIRDFKDNNKTKEALLVELEFYLSDTRYLFFDDQLQKTADFIVDGMLTTAAQVKDIKNYLNQHA